MVHNDGFVVAAPARSDLQKGYQVKKNLQARSALSRCLVIIVASIFLGGLLSACSSGPTIRTDIDETANFSQYKTYNYFDPLGIEGRYDSPVFGEHFRAAINSELGQRKYRLSDNPDLVVNITVRADDKVRMRSYTAPYMSGHYYRRPGGYYGGTAAGVGVSTGTRPTRTTEASVFIDFVDIRRHQLVWQGVAVIDVNDKVAQQLRNAIYTTVDMLLEQYPHTAGQ
jgi:hypothetical protein